MQNSNGKGDTYRRVNRKKWDEAWARLENKELTKPDIKDRDRDSVGN